MSTALEPNQGKARRAMSCNYRRRCSIDARRSRKSLSVSGEERGRDNTSDGTCVYSLYLCMPETPRSGGMGTWHPPSRSSTSRYYVTYSGMPPSTNYMPMYAAGITLDGALHFSARKQAFLIYYSKCLGTPSRHSPLLSSPP